MKYIVTSLATGLGAGLMPKAPGTWGSLLGIALAYGLSFLPQSIELLTLIAFTVLSVWIADMAEKIFDEEDCSKIVIDEICGMAVTLVLFPLNLKTILVGFFLFRFFDVVKIPPARQLENLGGGWGIVLDDIAAGIYSAAILSLIF